MKTETYLISLFIMVSMTALAIILKDNTFAIFAVGMIIIIISDDICERLGKKP